MADILVIATAGLKPDQLEDKNNEIFPRVDYLELKRLLDIDILNYDIYTKSIFGNSIRFLETQLRSDLFLTYLSLRAKEKYKTVFAMSERVGLPFASYRVFNNHKITFFSMFQSWSWRQELAVSKLQLLKHMDGIAVHCQSMQEKLSELGAPNNSIQVVPYSIDEKFFSPCNLDVQQSNLIFTVGETRSRNYTLLFEAISDLPVKLVAAASGMWYAREKKKSINSFIPSNVEIVTNLPHYQLKAMYSQSSFVVLPVYNQISSAGVTGLLEAACLERAVIATRSRGLQDFLIDGVTGIFVEPNSVEAMRNAIQYLLAHPEVARKMGKNARQRVEAYFNLENYVESLANFISKH